MTTKLIATIIRFICIGILFAGGFYFGQRYKEVHVCNTADLESQIHDKDSIIVQFRNLNIKNTGLIKKSINATNDCQEQIRRYQKIVADYEEYIRNQ